MAILTVSHLRSASSWPFEGSQGRLLPISLSVYSLLHHTVYCSAFLES